MRRESACAIVMTLRRPCHTCILQTRYKLVYTRAARSPHNLFLMLLMFLLSHRGCFHLAKGRNALGKAARCQLQQEERGGGRVLAFRCPVLHGHYGAGSALSAFTPAFCGHQTLQLPRELLCCGEGLQFLQRDGCGAEHRRRHWASVGVCGRRGQA